MQLVRSALNSALTDITATGATFDPAALWIGIFSAVVDNGVDTVIGDVTAPDVADYPRQAITAWGTVYSLTDGSPVRDDATKTFTPPDDVTPTSVVGVALYDALTAGNLVGFKLLSVPVSLNTTADRFSIALRLTLDQSGRWDVSVSWNG